MRNELIKKRETDIIKPLSTCLLVDLVVSATTNTHKNERIVSHTWVLCYNKPLEDEPVLSGCAWEWLLNPHCQKLQRDEDRWQEHQRHYHEPVRELEVACHGEWFCFRRKHSIEKMKWCKVWKVGRKECKHKVNKNEEVYNLREEFHDPALFGDEEGDQEMEDHISYKPDDANLTDGLEITRFLKCSVEWVTRIRIHEIRTFKSALISLLTNLGRANHEANRKQCHPRESVHDPKEAL